ncbi:MAG TPA: hypothetical protein VKX28_14550, partial [Xanthobacteraceae bacterium]|nr:hypothetical protein [Xanthobacteraceae bacterium]
MPAAPLASVAHGSRHAAARAAALLIRNLGGSGSDWFDIYGISEVLEAPDEALGMGDLRAALEVVGT